MNDLVKHVDCWSHPLLADGRTVRIARPGQCLADVLSDWVPYGQSAVAIVNGVSVPSSQWHTIIIQADDIIQARTTLHGGGDSNPIAVIASIALLISLGPTGFFGAKIAGLGLGTFGTAALTAGLGTLGIITINTLFPPNLPSIPGTGGGGGRQLFSLSGGANRARPYDPRPLLLGTHRIFPDLVAKEYTEYDSESEQYLNQIFDAGPGHLTFGDMFLGETRLSAYEEVTTQAQVDRITLVKGNVDTLQGGEISYREEDYQTYITRTTPAKTTRIAFDITAQHSALKDGKLVGRDIKLRAEYRREGTSNWTVEAIDIAAAPQDRIKEPIRRSYTFDVPAAVWECRIRSRAFYTKEALEEPEISIQVHLAQIRAFQDDEADFKGFNPIAINVKASGQLYGRLENINLIATNTLDAADTSADPYDYSNPADILLWWYRGYRVDGKLICGYGYDDGIINMDQLDAFRKHCDNHGLQCNIYVLESRDEDEIAMLIARCGWGRIDQSTGKHGVIYEDEGTPVTAVITPDNIVAGSLNVSYENENLADEIVGEFVDRDSDFQRNTLRRPVPESGTNGEFPVSIFLEGITDGEQAAKEINRMAAAQFYHTRTYSWEMDESGPRAIVAGTVVGMANGLTGPGRKGGRLREIKGNADGARRAFIPLRDDLPTSGSIWIWCLNDTVLATQYTLSDDKTQYNLGKPIPAPYPNVDDDPLAYQYMAFDSNDAYTQVRVVGIEPAGPSQFKFIARDELQAYYDARTSDLTHDLLSPEQTTGRLQAVTGFRVAENELGVRIFYFNHRLVADTVGYEIRFGAVNLSYDNMENLNEGLIQSSPFEVMDKPGDGTWRFAIVRVFSDGQRSTPAFTTAVLGPITRGLDGEDGAGYEDIFVAVSSAAKITDDALLPDPNWNFDEVDLDDGKARGTLTYYDGYPDNVDEINPYIIRFWRPVSGTPARDEDIGEVPWTQDTAIRIRGVRGIDGADGEDGPEGEDGQGFEYIFTAKGNDEEITGDANLPDPDMNYDIDQLSTDAGVVRGNRAYYDGTPPNLNDVNPFLVRFWRRIEGAPAKNSDIGTVTWNQDPAIRMVGRDGQKGDKGDDGTANRGPALYRYTVSTTQRDALNGAGSNLPASLVTIANDLTVGDNVNGDFVIFQRSGFSQWWAWIDNQDAWKPATSFIAARDIVSVNLSSITGNFSQLNVKGVLSADHIDADVRNWDGLWKGVQLIADGATGTFLLNTDPKNYHRLAVEFQWGNTLLTYPMALFNPKGPASSSSYQRFPVDGVGQNQSEWLELIGINTGGRSLVVLRTDEIELTITGIYGVKNPATMNLPPAPGTPARQSDNDISAANPSGNTVGYFATFEYANNTAFRNPVRLYDTSSSTTHRTDNPIPSSARSGTLYFRCRLTTSTNDGGVKGAWSARGSYNYGGSPSPTPPTGPTGPTPPTPPTPPTGPTGPTPSGSLRATITGPTSGSGARGYAFACAVSGGSGAITYQWEANYANSGWGAIRSGGTGSSYRYPHTGEAVTILFRCRVTRGGVTVVSNTITTVFT